MSAVTGIESRNVLAGVQRRYDGLWQVADEIRLAYLKKAEPLPREKSLNVEGYKVVKFDPSTLWLDFQQNESEVHVFVDAHIHPSYGEPYGRLRALSVMEPGRHTRITPISLTETVGNIGEYPSRERSWRLDSGQLVREGVMLDKYNGFIYKDERAGYFRQPWDKEDARDVEGFFMEMPDYQPLSPDVLAQFPPTLLGQTNLYGQPIRWNRPDIRKQAEEVIRQSGVLDFPLGL